MSGRVTGGAAKAMQVKRRNVADAALERVSETSSVSSGTTTTASLLSADTHNEPDNRENIKVCVRIRPLLRNENDANETVAYSWERTTITQLNSVAIQQQSNGHNNRKSLSGGAAARNDAAAASQTMPSHTFDQLFFPDNTNEQIYETLVKDIVIQAMRGFHGSVFAYGQTASGKTFTMHGTRKLPGVIPLAIHECFDVIQMFPDREFLFRVSYLEVYNEQVHDLLNSEPTAIKIQYDPKVGTVLSGVKEMVVVTPQQVIAMIESGEAQRHVGATDMNEKSSRAHSLFKIIIESHARSAGPHSPVRVSTLNLVDLAGSENAKMTNAKGTRALEAKFINQSLLTLSTIIQRLSEEKPGYKNRQHYPYRDSKLTRLMQAALSGNAQIAIICTISPAASCIDETNNTLKFASRAKRIKMDSRVNESMDDKTLLRQYREEIEQLKAKLTEMETIMLTGRSMSVDMDMTGEDMDDDDKPDDQAVIMLQMIDHMERLILKSESLAPAVSDSMSTPSKAGTTAVGETSFFVRKPPIRRGGSLEPGKSEDPLTKEKTDVTDDTSDASSLPGLQRGETDGDDDNGYFASPSGLLRGGRTESVESGQPGKDEGRGKDTSEGDTSVPVEPAAVLTNVTSILSSLREQVAKSKSKPHRRLDSFAAESPRHHNTMSPGGMISPAPMPMPLPPSSSPHSPSSSKENTQAMADLLLQVRLLEADNRFLQDAVERKDLVMERLTEGLKDVQRVQDELVNTNEELAVELDDTRRALEEAARQLWDMTQERDRLASGLGISRNRATPTLENQTSGSTGQGAME
mmetsp:Transcript_35947/g.36629  ORF Transcript_35947/g.36629 Transcript_35947/m.36629 type:complete len:805 (+) Transcript_35947:326-2740(+)|eukprot:CAMPEP_0182416960 /NCGR_PEP_ID=MMETSP1167-20130531/1376_1 /TAXON_ID=2988 /ORGANISM="Mallomonas Sp, Strain CCMP3275" /LENGTH=804 /DNA_ID=CAMNT_0024590183 /DNA_START=282 /DNA_END=2696 /DNA_ORIENTATION=-